jgi:hypothetical protein
MLKIPKKRTIIGLRGNINKKFMKKIVYCLSVAFFLLIFPNYLNARTNATDWYIKNFESEISVNRDSTLLIKEKILADCGNAQNKHGIFRILPTVFRTKDKEISMPIRLISITNFSGQNISYTAEKNFSDKTLTWKIGDANKTVTGENEYLITYEVKNAILFDNPEFDEFYWNLNGNFWDLEINNFTGKIIFPSEATKDNIKIDYYRGILNSKDKSSVNYSWAADNILEFSSIKYDGTIVPQTLADERGPLVITDEEEKFSHNVVLIFYCYWINRDIEINKTRVAFFKKNEDEYALIEKNVPYSLAISKYIPKDKEITLDVLKEAKRKKREYDECFGSGFPV